tara:strand:+ start:385 stop:1341 length:957 start_codon:yes stop_codon:yes gene_type:complete
VAEKKKNLFDPPEEGSGLATGLLNFFFPAAQAQENMYTAKWDIYSKQNPQGAWKIPQLTTKANIARNPRVQTNYRSMGGYRGDVLARLDLQADLDKRLKKQGVKSDRWGTRSVQNAQPYDFNKHPNKALSSERVLVSRVIPLKASSDGTINFDRAVNQKDRDRVYKIVTKNIANGQNPFTGLGKQAQHGPIGQIDRTMTKDQINFIRNNGVRIVFNPATQNVMTTVDGRVIKNVPNGRAITYGGSVYVVDQNWGTRGIQYYNSLSEMPKEMRENIKSGPLERKLKFPRSGGLGDARQPLGGSPSRFTGLMQYIPRGGR